MISVRDDNIRMPLGIIIWSLAVTIQSYMVMCWPRVGSTMAVGNYVWALVTGILAFDSYSMAIGGLTLRPELVLRLVI